MPTEQRDDELPGPPEALPRQPDDHHLHHASLLPVIPRRLRVCHLHHVEVCKPRTHPPISQVVDQILVIATMMQFISEASGCITSVAAIWRSPLSSCLLLFSIKPSSSCGPFRELKTMFQAGKRWVEKLEEGNHNLSVLAKAHSYLVEHPFFLFLGAGIFL